MNDMRFPLHARVALRPGADTVYLMAVAGTEGWVRDHKVDNDGFEMVKIEWDKAHWRYNGQPDGWTYAEHFKVIGPPQPEAPPAREEPTPEPEDEVIAKLPDSSDDEVESYIDELSEAMEAASEGEAFMMITVKKAPHPENPNETVYMPSIFQANTSKEAAMLLDIQLAECASASYQEMVFQLLNAMRKDDPPPRT